MSQPQSTILNGPSGELTMAFREAQEDNMINKQPPPQIHQNFQQQPQLQQQQQQQPQLQRPPLQRVDSRATLPQRPPFINPQGAPFRPVLQRPQFAPNQQQQPPPFLQKQPSIQRPPPSPNQARPNLPPRPFPPRPQQPLQPQQQPQFQPQHQQPLQQQQQPQPRPPPPQRFQAPPQVSFEEQPHRAQILDPNEELQPNLNESNKTLSFNERKLSVENDKDEKEEEKVVSKPPTPPSTLQLSSDKISSSPSPQPETVIEVKAKSAKGNDQHLPPVASTDKFDKIKKEVNENKNEVIRNAACVKKEGDNDSGVDESTQGNENTSNGDHNLRKSSRNTSRLTTPTKNRSFSRGSKSPHLKSPDSIPGTPSSADRKKLPMNKIQVGSAPSPNLKVVKSKIGSLSNATHRPGGGNIKIEHKKVDLSNTTSRIGAKNENYVPSGGEKKIVSMKLQWNAKSKIGSLENATHKPKGGDKKIETVKLDFKDKAKPKVGSKDNMKHVPGGGDVKSEPEDIKREADSKKDAIESKKLNIKVESKVGSLHNVKHKPGGGDKKIFDDKEYLRQKSGMSNDNNSMTGSQDSLPSQPSDAREPLSDENLNRERLTTNE